MILKRAFLAVLLIAGSAAEPAWAAGSTQVYFSPRGGCTQAIVNAVNQAKTSILVQAYSFTSKPIAEALLQAHQRGVQVRILADKTSRRKGEQAAHLAGLGVSVSVDSAHAIAHNKVIVIDGKIVITGSFNFTTAAEKSNAENLLVIQDPVLAGRYTENWNKHSEHSKPY